MCELKLLNDEVKKRFVEAIRTSLIDNKVVGDVVKSSNFYFLFESSLQFQFVGSANSDINAFSICCKHTEMKIDFTYRHGDDLYLTGHTGCCIADASNFLCELFNLLHPDYKNALASENGFHGETCSNCNMSTYERINGHSYQCPRCDHVVYDASESFSIYDVL